MEGFTIGIGCPLELEVSGSGDLPFGALTYLDDGMTYLGDQLTYAP